MQDPVQLEVDLGQPWPGPVRVIRSERRRRTVSARVVGGILELRVPARMPRKEEPEWVAFFAQRLAHLDPARRPGDRELEERARELNGRYFAGRLSWASIRFTPAQKRRWGSCSVPAGDIRISERARSLPPWVLDYLLVHELAHLEHDDHGAAFWEAVRRYPRTERARGYLMALDDSEEE
ncbi:MAG: M48 metallopeptidase family protein [Candidatus Dormibacteria bacterium]